MKFSPSLNIGLDRDVSVSIKKLETSSKEKGTEMSVLQSKTATAHSQDPGDTTGSGILRADDNDLRHYVEEMMHLDRRFVGMAKYVYDINFYWSLQIDTACAGHGFIFFNPEFWDKLPESKKKTVIAHEIWHLILDHLDRGDGFDPDTYNQAADHVINIGLDADGFDMDGDFGDITPCFDKQYKGLSTEQIYKKIWTKKRKNPDSAPKAVPGTPSKDQIEDLVKEALEGSGKDLQQQKEENKAKVEEVTESPPGDQPGGERILIESRGVKVFIKEAPYEEIFEDFLTDPLSGGKRTYMRPSRRQIKGGLRLKGSFPKRGRKNRLTHLVYALDVSGSITAQMRTQFLRSAKTLKEKLNPQLMTVILWDTSIQMEKVFREDEKLDGISIHAGGGTDLRPVYKRVRQINPEALVIFTDMQVIVPPKPDWETIWFVPNKYINSACLNQATYGDIYLVPEDGK